MKRFFNNISLAVLLLAGCSDPSEGLNDRLNKDQEALQELQQHIAVLEGGVVKLNVDLASIQTLRGGVVVYKCEGGASTGWSITLSNGAVVNVPAQAPKGNAPVFSLDADCFWMVDYGTGAQYVLDVDGNKVSSVGVGAQGSNGSAGSSPMLGIDSQNCWKVSFDGGATWSSVPGPDGNPVPVVVSVGDSLFEDVTSEGNTLLVTLKGGDVLTLPIASGFLFRIKDAEGVQSFAPGEQRHFQIETEGVADAVVSAPKGWKAVLTETELIVTAAPGSKAVVYDTESFVSVFAVALSGHSTICKIEVANS